jgi:hypothetical protein
VPGAATLNVMGNRREHIGYDAPENNCEIVVPRESGGSHTLDGPATLRVEENRSRASEDPAQSFQLHGRPSRFEESLE